MLSTEKVRLLGDYGGLWSLCLRCRCCRHMAEIQAPKLIAKYGAQQRLRDVTNRLYCRRCQEKYCHCRGKNFEALVSIQR